MKNDWLNRRRTASVAASYASWQSLTRSRTCSKNAWTRQKLVELTSTAASARASSLASRSCSFKGDVQRDCSGRVRPDQAPARGLELRDALGLPRRLSFAPADDRGELIEKPLTDLSDDFRLKLDDRPVVGNRCLDLMNLDERLSAAVASWRPRQK